jgi:hypothetical protein
VPTSKSCRNSSAHRRPASMGASGRVGPLGLICSDH